MIFFLKILKIYEKGGQNKCKFVNGIDNALASTYDHRALRINFIDKRSPAGRPCTMYM